MMNNWIKGAMCVIAMTGAATAADAATVLTFTFAANGSGVFAGMDPLTNVMFNRPVSGATLNFTVPIFDGQNGGFGAGANGSFGIGANTTGITFSSQGSGYGYLRSSGQACFTNPGATLPAVGRIAVDPGCGQVSFRQQYRYSYIEFSGLIDGLTITEGGVSGDAYVVPFVPEPATWALMLTGFGLTGYALRRRRLRPVPAI
jgi:hypothetical protein